MKKRYLFLLLPILASCSFNADDSSISSNYDDHKTIPDDIFLNFDYNSFKDFKEAYDVYKDSNESFPTLVLDFDERDGYDTKYTISGASSIENRNKLENTKFTLPKFSYVYIYDKFVTQEDKNKAISLEFTYTSPITEIKGFDNTKIEFSIENDKLRLLYSGVQLLTGKIKYDSKYVDIETVTEFKNSLSKDVKYIA